MDKCEYLDLSRIWMHQDRSRTESLKAMEGSRERIIPLLFTSTAVSFSLFFLASPFSAVK